MKPTDLPAPFRSGFVAILGAPNVGKSTLLNRILGQKLSITSKKPQTTRNRILGVAHRTRCQFVFLDTPGIHEAKTKLNSRIVEAALSTLKEADLFLLVADAESSDESAERLLLKNLARRKEPVLLALNKIDRVQRTMLLRQIERWSKAFSFHAVVPVSAKRGEQVGRLLEEMENALPAGPPLFPADQITDLPARFIAAEMIREKVFRLTGQEVPYATMVTIDAFHSIDKGRHVRISATIHVERASQKGILIGKQGAKLKQIGAAARKEIAALLDKTIYLKLFVRVQKNWTRDTKALRKFGY